MEGLPQRLNDIASPFAGGVAAPRNFLSDQSVDKLTDFRVFDGVMLFGGKLRGRHYFSGP
jgi:hypothetical protein